MIAARMMHSYRQAARSWRQVRTALPRRSYYQGARMMRVCCPMRRSEMRAARMIGARWGGNGLDWDLVHRMVRKASRCRRRISDYAGRCQRVALPSLRCQCLCHRDRRRRPLYQVVVLSNSVHIPSWMMRKMRPREYFYLLEKTFFCPCGRTVFCPACLLG